MNEYVKIKSIDLENTKKRLDALTDFSTSPKDSISCKHYQLSQNISSLHILLKSASALKIVSEVISQSAGKFSICYEGMLPIHLTINDQKQEVSPKRIIVINDNLAFTIVLEKGYSGNLLMIHFSESTVHNFQLTNILKVLAILKLEGLLQYYFFFQILIFNSNITTNLLQTILANQIILDVLKVKSPLTEKRIIDNINEYLLTNLSRACPSLEELSQIAGLSVSSLKSKFMYCESMSPRILFSDAQMEKANIMLKEGYSVKQIAIELGFSNASNFINGFKKYGVSPKNKNLNF